VLDIPPWASEVEEVEDDQVYMPSLDGDLRVVTARLIRPESAVK